MTKYEVGSRKAESGRRKWVSCPDPDLAIKANVWRPRKVLGVGYWVLAKSGVENGVISRNNQPGTWNKERRNEGRGMRVEKGVEIGRAHV